MIRLLRRIAGRVRREYWWMRARIARRLVPRRIVRSRGLRLTLSYDNFATQYRTDSYNTKEPETLDWIDRSMAEGGVLIDVGANIGLYAMYAALRHPALRVLAFEPEYANLHVLRDNVLLNRLADRVEIYAIALRERPGISHLHLHDVTPGTALHTLADAPIAETLDHEPVVCR